MFSPDGRRLFATENDFDAERGVLGVYDASDRFRRLGEIDLGGVGPHEVIALSDGRTLAVAIGGIATHPDYPRAKLNLPEMRPGLVLVDIDSGDIVDRAEADAAWRQVSLRHLCEDASGVVWFGGQNEAAMDNAPLIGRFRRDGALTMLSAPTSHLLAGYVGSIATSRDRARIVATSPRGGAALILDAASGAVLETRAIADVCGAAALPSGLALSDGGGGLSLSRQSVATPGVHWDNHLTAL